MNASPAALTVNPGQLVYPESPRWRDGRLWFSDVHAYAIKTVDLHGRVAVVAEVPGRPAGIGFLPDGRLLVASALDRRLWTWDGSDLRLAADLGDVALGLLNDMVVDGRGRAYISDTGFNLMAGDPPRSGQIILYQDSAPGTTRVRIVSTDVMFPNGAAVSQDGSHYWVAETAANRVSMFDIDADGSLSTRHTLIDLPDMCDGLCLDVDGAIWVALLRRGEFWRVLPDGSVGATLSAEGRLAVACTLGGEGRGTLFLCSAETTMDELAHGRSIGHIHTIPAISGAGWP